MDAGVSRESWGLWLVMKGSSLARQTLSDVVDNEPICKCNRIGERSVNFFAPSLLVGSPCSTPQTQRPLRLGSEKRDMYHVYQCFTTRVCPDIATEFRLPSLYLL